MPDFDHCGYEMAVNMLVASRRPGVYASDHIQWETLRKRGTAYANVMRVTPQATRTVVALGDEKGRMLRFTTDPTASTWFSRFKEGCKRRMGQDHRPNKGLTVNLVLAVLEECEQRIFNAPSLEDANRWTVFGTYVAISYVMSLRGNEGVLLDLQGLIEFQKRTKEVYFVVVLFGKFKGEIHDRRHIIPVIKKTGSGINVELWIDWLITAKKAEGHSDGPAVSDKAGRVLTSRSLDDSLHEILGDLFVSQNDLFPPDIRTVEKLRECYHIFRTLRLTSNTRAVEMNVSETDRNVINRWEGKKKIGQKKSASTMSMYYTEFDQLIGPFVRYGTAL
jgi:hypothetical protein